MALTYVQFLDLLNYGGFESILRYDEDRHAIVSVKTSDVQNKLTNIGFTQDLVRDFGLPTELSIPCNHWTALRCASDFANSMSEILEELRAQELLLLNPTSRIDIKSALDLFEFPNYIKDLILDFASPMLPSVMAQELFQQRKRWKNHDKLLSYVVSCQKRSWFDREYALNVYLNEKYEDSWPNYFKIFPFQSIEDHWIGIRERRLYIRWIAGIFLEENCEYIDRFRIGFLQITGIINRNQTVRECENVSHEKIPVIYASSPSTPESHPNENLHVFQPSQWNEYVSKVEMNKSRNPFFPPKLRLKFTCGPTLREVIHQDVHNDVKIMVSDMVKKVISILQTSCRFWASTLLASLEFCGKEWRVMNGSLKAFRLDMPEDENVSREITPKGLLWFRELSCPKTSNIGEIDSDPIKAARKIKWQRTKENSQRKRRQKYEKDRKFRRKRVHNKVWATKVSRT